MDTLTTLEATRAAGDISFDRIIYLLSQILTNFAGPGDFWSWSNLGVTNVWTIQKLISVFIVPLFVLIGAIFAVKFVARLIKKFSR